MTWYQLFSTETGTWVTLAVAVITFALLLLRRFNVAIVSLIAAAFLILAGIVTPADAFVTYINWDVLGILWGYGILAMALERSGLPAWIANRVLARLTKESQVMLFLCILAMFLSSFMANPVVVLMLAPLAIELSKRMKSSLFIYMVALAVSSNMVTTVTMISDPPALIMATYSGMEFFDFFWFQGKLSIGSMTVIGLAMSLAVVWWQFRGYTGKLTFQAEDVPLRSTPLVIFGVSVLVLALVPWNDLGAWNHPGLAGLATGLAALAFYRKYAGGFLRSLDWNTLAFLAGIFIVIATVEQVGLLRYVEEWLSGLDLPGTGWYLAIFVWVSVLLSSFIDNVPFTILMLPVCANTAALLGVSPFPFYFGMLIGTGIGGNLTPVGAAPNVMACGILEKHGEKITLGRYMKIAVPFSLSAVLAVHLLVQWLWL